MKRGRLIKKAVLMAEDLFPEPKSGERKKAWVVDFINEHINMPILNERQEERVIAFWVDIICELVFDAIDRVE